MTDTRLDASKAADGARDASQQLRRTRGYRVLVAVGLVSYGVVHLLIAWIALQAAFGNGRVAEQHDEAHRTRKRLSSAGRALVYLLLGISAFRLVLGDGGSKGQEDGLTSRLLSVPLGRILVIAVAVAVLGLGISQVVRGVRQTFTEDLSGDRTGPTRVLGTVGYVAKGVAFAVVAGLFGWAALSYDAKKAGGLDAALHTVASQPQGSLLLTVLAAGFAAFGLFCFVWARNART